ncbi:hypothetical protein L914_03064 [Phytophthora nicotianae]|uniref:Peptidase A2 domain-containing protein n=1 Tax=Phytophthora nicotianae TaxID=4792 RepID=W2NXI0_PHYNI|nr:hypothetical protein L914_03064 [Phytophthora nicotianae]
MRTLVQGAVDDHRTRIVLDTGANVSVITNTFAKKLRLRDIPDHGRSIDIQGISEGKVSTTRRALARSRSGGRWSTSSRCGLWRIVRTLMWCWERTSCSQPEFGWICSMALLNFQMRVCIPLVKTKNMVDSMEHTSMLDRPKL